MTDDELREKVIKHDYEFKTLTASLADLSNSMKKLTEGLEQVIVLNERLITMDKDLKDSFKRVHARADKSDDRLEQFMKDLELVRLLVKYPKLLLFMGIGLYVMTFDGVRKAVFGI